MNARQIKTYAKDLKGFKKIQLGAKSNGRVKMTYQMTYGDFVVFTEQIYLIKKEKAFVLTFRSEAHHSPTSAKVNWSHLLWQIVRRYTGSCQFGSLRRPEISRLTKGAPPIGNGLNFFIAAIQRIFNNVKIPPNESRTPFVPSYGYQISFNRYRLNFNELHST